MSDLVTQLRTRAAGNPKRIVYPEAADPRVIRASERMVKMRLAKPLLVGTPQIVESKAREIGVNVSHIEIVDPKTPALVDRYARMLLADWKSRGITEMEATKRLENTMYFAAAMVHAGDADGFVGGAATTTADTVRAAIHCIGLKSTSSVVSSFFLMAMPVESFGENGGMIFSDCAVVPTPNVTQLTDIAIDAAANARIFLEAE